MTLLSLALPAAFAMPLDTSTSADVATTVSTCQVPMVAQGTPSGGELVGVDVQPVLRYVGTCGWFGHYELLDAAGVVAEGDVEPELFFGFDEALSVIGLPTLVPETAYTLFVETEFETFTTSFVTGGDDVTRFEVDVPALEVEVDDVVLLSSGRGPRAADVFAVGRVEAPPNVYIEVSRADTFTEQVVFHQGDAAVFSLRTSVVEGDPACFYARTRDLYGQTSEWAEVCEAVDFGMFDGDDEADDDDREPYKPSRCATTPAPLGLGALALSALLGLRRRR